MDKMPPGHTDYSLFPEYEFVYDDYYVNSYEWYCSGSVVSYVRRRKFSDTYFA